LSIDRTSWLEIDEKRLRRWFIANAAGIKGQIVRIPQKWVPVLRIEYEEEKL
jgi:hypothetical protein